MKAEPLVKNVQLTNLKFYHTGAGKSIFRTENDINQYLLILWECKYLLIKVPVRKIHIQKQSIWKWIAKCRRNI